VTALESRLYISLLGARTIVSATANVNPQALKLLRLVDTALDAYKRQKDRENLAQLDEEDAHAAGN
jgi:hypothetical protein